MNCLEFRRRLLEDPFDNPPDLEQHAEQCEGCARYAREERAREAQLRAIVGQITPPPELADNIQLAVRLEQRGKTRRQAWYAVAASVLLVVGATLASLVSESWERGNMALAQSVLHHIDDEAHHLRAAGPVSHARVKYVFARFGARLTSDIGQVNFAAECLMRHRNGVHLILVGRKGPITAFFMPGERPEQAITIDSERFQGQIVPTQWGSIAVVGELGESLTGLAQHLAQTVQWPGQDTGLIGGITGDRALLSQQ